jgi:hypothetical protein
MPWRPLGQLLVERGLITEVELEEALAEHASSGKRLGEVLVKRGLVSGPDLTQTLMEQLGVELKKEEGFGSGLWAAIKERHPRGAEGEEEPDSEEPALPPAAAAEVVSSDDSASDPPPLVLVDDSSSFAVPANKKCGLLAWRSSPGAGRFAETRALSPGQDLREAAANLFRCLRELDQLNLDLIVAEKLPEEGLGAAINDRLRRASRPQGAAV